MVRRRRERASPPPTPGDVVSFVHRTAVHTPKRRPGVIVAVHRATATAWVLPGLSEPPRHALFVRFAWSPAVAYSGLDRETCFDLLDANEVPLAELERVGKLPPEALHRIIEAFESLGSP